MLARRIQGVMRQYGPLVAFLTVDVLFGITSYIHTGPPGKYELPPNDTLGLPLDASRALRSLEYINSDLVQLPIAGSGATPVLEAENRLATYLDGEIARGNWYDGPSRGRGHAQGDGALLTDRFDAIVPWIALQVSRWLKFDWTNLPTSFGGLGRDEPAMPRRDIDLPKLMRRIGDVADWAAATRPNIMSLPISTVLARTARWHAEMARRATMKAAKAGEVVHRFKDGWTFQKLTEREQLRAEADSQGICVGQQQYVTSVARGTMEIYSLRDPHGVPHVTVEVSIEDARAQLLHLLHGSTLSKLSKRTRRTAEQIKGRGNALITKPALCLRLEEAFRVVGISAVDTSDWTGADWYDRSKSCFQQQLARAVAVEPKREMEGRKKRPPREERRENPLPGVAAFRCAYGRP